MSFVPGMIAENATGRLDETRVAVYIKALPPGPGRRSAFGMGAVQSYEWNGFPWRGNVCFKPRLVRWPAVCHECCGTGDWSLWRGRVF